MKTKLLKRAGFVFLLFIWLGWDVYQSHSGGYQYISSFPSRETRALKIVPAEVSLVRSDDLMLPHPCPRDSVPSDSTVMEMVRRAVELIGGFQTKIHSGMTVLIKPNIVEQQPSGSGNVTDIRVVEAVTRLVDEIDHGNIAIIVGDGSPRPFTTFEKSQSSGKTPWVQLFDVPGYQALKTKMLALGINFRLSNLNGNSDTNPIPELMEVPVPAGGQAQPQGGKYFVHRDVVNADAYINIPVMKIHEPGITCALKNQIGIASSALYGFSKTAGTPNDNYRHKLIHYAQMPYAWSDKEIVDLCSIAKVTFTVVDALMCLDLQKSILQDKSNQVRMNVVLASRDAVAADHVCARLMGLNPDDVEHITLAERVGLGTNNPAEIIVNGADIGSTMKRFRKNPSVESQKFGQGNRDWLIRGSFSISGISNPIEHPFLPDESGLAPQPGGDGWSAGEYFINDRVNLKDYFASAGAPVNNVAAYAFAYVDAPAAGEAELWVGSDEAMKIWLNGQPVYTFGGTRTFANTALLSEKKKITLLAGKNRLLVKTLQNINSSYFDFSLNICSVDTNRYFAGNRVWGLKFYTNPNPTSVNEEIAARDFILLTNYPNPFNPSTRLRFRISHSARALLEVFSSDGERVATLYDGELRAGEYEQTFDASRLPAGVYLCRLSAGGRTAVRKLLLIR